MTFAFDLAAGLMLFAAAALVGIVAAVLCWVALPSRDLCRSCRRARVPPPWRHADRTASRPRTEEEPTP